MELEGEIKRLQESSGARLPAPEAEQPPASKSPTQFPAVEDAPVAPPTAAIPSEASVSPSGEVCVAPLVASVGTPSSLGHSYTTDQAGIVTVHQMTEAVSSSPAEAPQKTESHYHGPTSALFDENSCSHSPTARQSPHTSYEWEHARLMLYARAAKQSMQANKPSNDGNMVH